MLDACLDPNLSSFLLLTLSNNCSLPTIKQHDTPLPGESKVPMVVSSLHDDLDKTTPAGRVRPDSGKLFWFLDSKAAAGLPDRAATPAAN